LKEDKKENKRERKKIKEINKKKEGGEERLGLSQAMLGLTSRARRS
jgi:hypothetical protein